ncbi:MAG: hypothetical protein JWR69_2262 [Pedosphaera sp.]|nr:hypothetical protein [Pedosphaera sp.]
MTTNLPPIDGGFVMGRWSRWNTCFLLLLASTLSACTPKETQTLLEPSRALGTVLAEETAQISGPKKGVVIIVPDASWGPSSSVEEAFKAGLKKKGVTVLEVKAARLGDPMHPDQVGMLPSDFFELMQKFPEAAAIVSLVGVPRFAPGDVARLPADHAPLLVVATAMLGNVPGVPGGREGLPGLIDAGVVRFAIIDGSGTPDHKTNGKDGEQELFAQHYLVLRGGVGSLPTSASHP